jgi:hypothetical protein
MNVTPKKNLCAVFSPSCRYKPHRLAALQVALHKMPRHKNLFAVLSPFCRYKPHRLSALQTALHRIPRQKTFVECSLLPVATNLIAWLLCRQHYTECHATKTFVQFFLLPFATNLIALLPCRQHYTECHATKPLLSVLSFLSLQTSSPCCSADSITQNATPQKPLCSALSFLSLQTSSPYCSADSTTQNVTPQKTRVLTKQRQLLLLFCVITQLKFVLSFGIQNG